MTDDPLADLPFTWHETKDGRVRVSHRGRHVRTLRGPAAERFLDGLDGLDEAGRQQRMARVTGQFRYGNERQAQRHPRNR
jgi:hypothetical protein